MSRVSVDEIWIRCLGTKNGKEPNCCLTALLCIHEMNSNAWGGSSCSCRFTLRAECSPWSPGFLFSLSLTRQPTVPWPLSGEMSRVEMSVHTVIPECWGLPKPESLRARCTPRFLCSLTLCGVVQGTGLFLSLLGSLLSSQYFYVCFKTALEMNLQL